MTLVAGTVAQLLCNGRLRAIDGDGRRIESRRVGHVLELFSSTLDDDASPSAHAFVEDLVADYCLDGNAVAVPVWSRDGSVRKLQRMSSWDSDIQRGAAGAWVYRLTAADEGELTVYKASRDVIHARWPRLLRHGRTRSTREGFALAPVVALRPALDIGLRGDLYIRSWFREGSQSKLHVDFAAKDGQPPMNVELRKELEAHVRRATSSRMPLVTFDGTSSYLRDVPQDSEALALRQFQVQEVARVYGVPAPLINVDMTSWGAGIEQLARLFWRFCVRQHLNRFIAPLSLRLLPRGVRFDPDTTELLRGDDKAAKDLIMGIQGDAQRPPIASREELRRIVGLPRDVDGTIRDEPYSRGASGAPGAPADGGGEGGEE